MDEDQTTDNAQRADYDVGYKKPPAATRFEPGKSGNKAGRPKGSRNLATEWHDELNEKVTVNVGGKKKKITKQRAIVKRIAQQAMEGKERAASLALNGALLAEQPTAIKEDRLTTDEDKILRAYKNRIIAEHNALNDAAIGEQDE